MLHIKYIETEDEYQQARVIRAEVFIRGQNVPQEIELDEYEDTATHILALDDGNPVGTARWRYTDEGVKLERFAVPEQQRGQGVGIALVEFALNELREENLLYLNAQEHVIGFYEKLDFEGEGNIFLEAEIPHLKMVYKLKKA
ncbi:MAG TPA: GNAT family N-acetyltransferase [Candidatus Marinimicrobia bacterium]|jgi:predicted GNAT family N-acyltransferase|nr:GNAT family N-acetyltransferase [Candidatus Neomarinimicrobiota bacterium]HJL75560.1 GNAT family N-acetyltransferase [Candidatus Neomarinimicrobiota bacterium]